MVFWSMVGATALGVPDASSIFNASSAGAALRENLGAHAGGSREGGISWDFVKRGLYQDTRTRRPCLIAP